MDSGYRGFRKNRDLCAGACFDCFVEVFAETVQIFPQRLVFAGRSHAGLLFRTVAETLRTIAADPRHLGAEASSPCCTPGARRSSIIPTCTASSPVGASPTTATVTQVRVEIDLSNGVELRPTPRVDLAAGQSMPVELDASGQTFTSWSVHVELGSGSA